MSRFPQGEAVIPEVPADKVPTLKKDVIIELWQQHNVNSAQISNKRYMVVKLCENLAAYCDKKAMAEDLDPVFLKATPITSNIAGKRTKSEANESFKRVNAEVIKKLVQYLPHLELSVENWPAS